MVMGNVTVHDFTTLAMVLIILLVRGHAEVAAIRFSPTSPPALANPRESEALPQAEGSLLTINLKKSIRFFYIIHIIGRFL
jgi:hypothetical protein